MQSDVNVNSFDKRSPSACNHTCEDYTDVVYSGDCGGENAYNLFEFKEGTLLRAAKRAKITFFTKSMLN